MPALINFLKKDPAAVSLLGIQQILALCGNGKLSDGSETSKELRQYLQIAKSENLFAYADSCLTMPFDKSGQVLQDVVNELGRRLDYQVENGLYQGKLNAVGNDGLWSDGEGHAIIVEVKTSDAYRINLDTVAGYQSQLQSLNRIAPSWTSSVLLIVGRQDTGDLEAQVRGSKHAWLVRIISIEALKKLVSLKENAESIAVRKIHELLTPFEYTRLDRIIEIAFTVAEDASGAAEEESSNAGLVQADHGPGHQLTPAAAIATIRSAILDKLRADYPPLIKKSRALFWSADKSVRAAITVSKKYPGGDYWYAYHAEWDEFLEQGKTGLYILGCIGSAEAFFIPYEWIHSRVDSLHVTERDDGRKHYHISLYPQASGKLAVHLKNGVDEALDLFSQPIGILAQPT